MVNIEQSAELLWNKANYLIPNGNSLLSKQKSLFLPSGWPAYFTKTNGIFVWDLDENVYKDFLFAVGTNSLGYNNPAVNSQVLKTVSDGVMSTLNCPEEVELAERLIALHPWSAMAKFARTGGEANAIAVRIARAATGRDKIAICGYHGWHDWYLAANLKSDNLDEHLIPGLKAVGVNSSLAETTYSFYYNQYEQLEQLVNKHSLAAVIMEVERSIPPEDCFLQKVRDLCNKHSIVLIFDECTSGFRETFGGLHLKYGINPDLAMFGKALGNGYAINAVLGKREIMEHAKDCFISSTNWTERIGPVAALATLNEMDRIKSWNILKDQGNYFRHKLTALMTKHEISVSFTGLPALTVTQYSSSKFPASEQNIFRTLLTEKLLKKGFLSCHLFYVSVKHTTDEIDVYLNVMEALVDEILHNLQQGQSLRSQLRSTEAHLTFGRLA